MKAKSKLFVVKNGQADPAACRLIRAQTARQVHKFLDDAAIKAARENTTVEIATAEQAVGLGAAGVKVEDLS